MSAEFIKVLARMSDCIYNMPSPLPHLLSLGDINLPNIDWINAKFTNLVATHCCPIIEDLFLEQLVQEPTKGNKILDSIFSEKELIDSKTFLSDHSMLLCHTLIPVHSHTNLDIKNPSLSDFESLTLSDPGYFRQLTIRGGGFKSPPPPHRSRKLLCQSSPYHTCEFYQVF